MDNFYILSELHLVGSGEDFHEDDNVKIRTTNGDIFKAQIVEIGQKDIRLTFNDYLDGEITIKYNDIESIEMLKE